MRYKKKLIFLLSSSMLFSHESHSLIVTKEIEQKHVNLEEIKLHALFLMQHGLVEESIEKYQQYVDLSKRHDFDILHQMGLLLFKHGIESNKEDVLLMTLYGAGLSGNLGATQVLEKALTLPHPQYQMIALNFLARFEDDRIEETLSHLMHSEFLGLRMQAAYFMSMRKHPHAVGQIESLMFKLPPQFKPFFPSFFALLGTDDATKMLRRFLEDSDPTTRIESILNIARMKRDDFLSSLRRKLTHHHIAELEATAFAIGQLRDSTSIKKLQKLTSSPTDTVCIAAILALNELGDKTYLNDLITFAKKGNLYAIQALGRFDGTEEILRPMLFSEDLQIRINASLALLQKQDPVCVHAICDILITDSKNLAFQPIYSVGRTLYAIKAIPSANLRTQDPTVDLAISFNIKEKILQDAMHLPEKAFLQIAKSILYKKQLDLVPSIINLLENIQSENCISLLKKAAETIHVPLIRNYCHLALFRMKEPGPHETYLRNWIMTQKDQHLIQMKPQLPWSYQIESSNYSLSPHETSQLLIDAFVAIASFRDEDRIEFLLEAIKHSNEINRYALMGLLMKATE